MKKILFSLLLIGVVSVATFGVTRAYFTTQDVLGGNTVSTATLNVNFSDPDSDRITVGNLLPGVWTGWQEVRFRNSGDVPLKYAWSADYVSQSGWDLWNQVNVQVKEGSFTDGLIYGHADWGSPLNELELVEGLYTLQPNQTRIVGLRFRLPASTDNYFQGLSTQFDLVIDATQIQNPGWTE